MQFGAIFPQMDGALSPAGIRAWVLGVEALGFDYVLVYEHVLGVAPGSRPDWPHLTRDTPFHEPLTLIAHLAALVPGLGFATGVLVLPQRQTALVAKQAAAADIFCGGRLRLGVGVGRIEAEYEALAQPFARRGRRCDEQLALLRRLWTEETVDFAGEFDRIDRAGINPLPVQRPIPLWIGGDSAAAMRRAGALGDGWMPHGRPGPGVAERAGAMLGIARQAGRPEGAVGIEGRVTLRDLEPREWWTELERWATMPGVTHLGIDTHGLGCASGGDHLAALGAFVGGIGGLGRRGP
ncbi:MAG: TIGR03619 family F420-dependent LLM class oxidoreductase [Chloroflexota bacterium]